MARAKLTEEQKVANKVEKKRAWLQAKELEAVGGPNSLFAHEAAEVTTDVAEWHLRRVKAIHAEDSGPWSELTEQMELLRLSAVERVAEEAVGAEWFARLHAKARRTYPSVGYWIGFWRRVLTGAETVALDYLRLEGPPLKTGFVMVVPTVEYPPAGWVPPLTNDEFDRRWLPFFGHKNAAEAETSDAVFQAAMTKLAEGCKR